MYRWTSPELSHRLDAPYLRGGVDTYRTSMLRFRNGQLLLDSSPAFGWRMTTTSSLGGQTMRLLILAVSFGISVCPSVWAAEDLSWEELLNRADSINCDAR